MFFFSQNIFAVKAAVVILYICGSFTPTGYDSDTDSDKAGSMRSYLCAVPFRIGANVNEPQLYQIYTVRSLSKAPRLLYRRLQVHEDDIFLWFNCVLYMTFQLSRDVVRTSSSVLTERVSHWHSGVTDRRTVLISPTNDNVVSTALSK